MDKRKLVLLLGALVIAIGTALAARSMFAGASAPSAAAKVEEPKGPKVLVSQRALTVGTIITADAVKFQQWPKDMVSNAYFIDGEANIDKLLGTVVRYPITAGEPITQGALVAPGDRGFLAAALGPGMRAVTVPTSANTGVAGFIFPGDRVDIVLTQTVKGEGNGPSLKAAETILRNVRVLATDQSTETETKDGKTQVRKFRNVTLEVTPKIAEKVAVSQTIGTLSLVLRSIADNHSELERAVASGDVKLPEGATRDQEEQLINQAMNRPQDGATTFVTGGDVSRFQRRSMPAPGEGRPAPSQGAGSGGAPFAAATPTGPTVTVMRGKVTSIEAVKVR